MHVCVCVCVCVCVFICVCVCVSVSQILYVETRKGQVTVPQVGSVILGKVCPVCPESSCGIAYAAVVPCARLLFVFWVFLWL